jgi:hypothetical protein
MLDSGLFGSAVALILMFVLIRYVTDNGQGGQTFTSQNIRLYVLVGAGTIMLCALMFFATVAFCAVGTSFHWIAPCATPTTIP